MSLAFNIPAMIAYQGRSRAEHTALVDGTGAVGFGDLERRVSRWANHFRSLGLQPGDHIGLCLTDHVDHVIAMLAAMRVACPFLCMDWKSSLEEVEGRVAKFDLKLVLCDQPNNMPPFVGVLRDDDWLVAVSRARDDFALPPIAGEATALLASSSGTTGSPGVVRVTHRALFARAIGENWLTLSPGAEDKYLRALPLAYTMGRGFGFSYFCVGCPIVLMPSLYAPAEYVDTIKRHGITHANSNPTLLRWLVGRTSEESPLLPGLKALFCTGATLSPDLKREVMGRVTPYLFEKYGAVATGVITLARPEDIRARPDSVGRPIFGVDIEIVDDDGNPVPVGTVGALQCRSPQAADPYENVGDEAGRESRPAGFWYTDDRGRVDEDGYLYFMGRSASLIIRAGLNIYAEELEEVLRDHPRIRDVAVLGRPSATLGDEPVALVVRQDNTDFDDRDLIAYCRAKISPNKVPMDFFYVDELPRALAGKLNRAALPALLHVLTEEREATGG